MYLIFPARIGWIMSGITFNLLPGRLAYQNLQSLDITKDYEEFTNAGSIFSIYKRITEDDRPAGDQSGFLKKIRIVFGTKGL